MFLVVKWRPPSISKLTPMVFNTGLTQLIRKYFLIIVENLKNENLARSAI